MKKLLNKKGFTLMEMLIVVAIIVILVAISVPTFTANLDEAKSATDAANLRAAKSAGAMYALDHEDGTYYYDIELGDIVTSDKKPSAYGECTTHNKEVIEVTITNGKAVADWEGGKDCGEE